MKELAFRVWDSFEKRYVFSEEMNAPDWIRRLSVLFENSALALDSGNNIAIEQFAGILDYSGKKVYEGDIMVVNGHKCAVKYRENYCDYCFMSIKYGYRVLNVTKSNITKNKSNVKGSLLSENCR